MNMGYAITQMMMIFMSTYERPRQHHKLGLLRFWIRGLQINELRPLRYFRSHPQGPIAHGDGPILPDFPSFRICINDREHSD